MTKARLIPLTAEQLEQLKIYAQAAIQESDKGTPGMILAQIFPIETEEEYGNMRVGFIPHAAASKIMNVLLEMTK